MRFSSEDARDDFARTVLYGLRPIDVVRDLAEKVAQRMKDRNNGRMWMAGHMRRGDFVTAGWAMEGTIQKHFDRIKSRLTAGRLILEQIHTEQKITPFPIPDVVPDTTQLSLLPPESSDAFFLATDERSEEGLKYVREHGAVLIGDLVTIDDRREFGWGIMVTDVLALVEQAVLSKAYYFYAHAMSSVAGGAAQRGKVGLESEGVGDPQLLFPRFMSSAKPQDGVYAASLNLKKLIYALEPAVSEALEPLVHATSNVVDAFGTMRQNDKEKAARSIEAIISSAEELCLAVTREVAMDDEFLANLRLYIDNTQALAKRLKERQGASFLRRFLHGIEMDDALHSVQDSFDSSMAAITMHHLRRKDHKTAWAVSKNREEDQLELMASEVEVTDAVVFQADVGLFWQGVSHARFNDTIADEDRNAPPDPDHRKRCIVRKFRTDSESEFFRLVVEFLLVARHPNLPQLHGFYYDDFTAGMVIKLSAVRPFESYLEQYCHDHSAKEVILFFLIVLSDLRQLVEFLEDNDILKDGNVVRSMLAGKNLMLDHLERVIVGPTYHSGFPVVAKVGNPAEQQPQPLELIVEAAGSYRPPPPPPGVDDADYWGSPVIQVVDSLRHIPELLTTDWHLAGGGFDWREEFLEQFDPPDPYEVEEFATGVDVEDISIGLVSAVAADKQISTWEQDSDTDSTTFSSRTSGSRTARKRPKRIPPVLRSSRRKRQE
ncbi:hypothetical protein FRC00_009026, partial [Tulasnella sp. 408]